MVASELRMGGCIIAELSPTAATPQGMQTESPRSQTGLLMGVSLIKGPFYIYLDIDILNLIISKS